MKIIFLFLCVRQLAGSSLALQSLFLLLFLLLSELCWFRNLLLVSCLHDTLCG